MIDAPRQSTRQTVFTPRYDKLRSILSEARKARAITQGELSERLGRVKTFVSKYETAVRGLDVIAFLDVAAALGIDPHDVIRELTED